MTLTKPATTLRWSRRFHAATARLLCLICAWLPLAALAACPPCDGYFDPSFAGDGARLLPFPLPSVDDLTSPVVLPRGDGSIAVAATCAAVPPATGTDVCVAVYRIDGSPDPSFGPANLGTLRLSELEFGETKLKAATVTLAGHLLMTVASPNMKLIRVELNDNGTDVVWPILFGFSLNPALSDDTQIVTSTIARADGSMLVAGSAPQSTSNNRFQMRVLQIGAPPDFLADEDFGTNGVAVVHFDPNHDSVEGDAYLEAMALQSDGKIIVAGSAEGQAALARIDTHGHLDLSFGGGDGRVVGDFGVGLHSIDALVIDKHDRIIIGGNTDRDAASGFGTEMVVDRLLADGTQDSWFGTFNPEDPPGPVVYGANHGGSNDDNLAALVLQPDGKIVAAGNSDDGNGFQRFEVLRFSGFDGLPDFDFGVDAASLGSFGCAAPFDDTATAVAMDRGIVIAGLCAHDYYTPNQTLHYGVARLKVDRIFYDGVDL